MERGDARAVIGAAERGAAARVGAEPHELADRGDAAARRRPAQRGAAVDVGLDLRSAGDEQLECLDAVAARRPGERLVEGLARVIRRPPGREAAVGPVEAAVRAGLGRADQLVEQVEAAEPGRCAQVAGMDAVLGQQLGGRGVAPEQGDDERRAAVAAGGDVDRRAGLEQHPRHLRQVAVCGLVQRRPPVRIGARDVGATLEQDRDEALVARRAGHPEQVVAVRAAGAHQLGEDDRAAPGAAPGRGPRSRGRRARTARRSRAGRRRGGAAPATNGSRARGRSRRVRLRA